MHKRAQDQKHQRETCHQESSDNALGGMLEEVCTEAGQGGEVGDGGEVGEAEDDVPVVDGHGLEEGGIVAGEDGDARDDLVGVA